MRKLAICIVLTVLIMATLAPACATPKSTPTPAPTSQPTATSAPTAKSSPAATATSAAQPIKQLRVSTWIQTTHFLTYEVVGPWGTEVEKRTNGRIKTTLYAGASLHAATDAFAAVRSGMVDVAFVSAAYFTSQLPMTNATSLPFAFANTFGGTRVVEELYPKYLRGEFEAQGVKLINLFLGAGSHIIGRKPISTLEDFKGAKVRSGGCYQTGTLEAWGAVPVNVIATEAYLALQRGTIDSAMMTIGAMEDYKLAEVSKNVTLVGDAGIIGTVTGLVISPKVWQDLAPDIRDIIYKVSRENVVAGSNSYISREKPVLENMPKLGVKIVKMDAAEVARLKKTAQVAWDQFIKDNEKQNRPARQLLEAMDSLSQKYSNIKTADDLMKLQTQNPVMGLTD